MKESIKQARHDKALANLLGITLEEVQAQRQKEESSDKVREAQAIFLFMEKPDAFIRKTCVHCKGTFLTNYKFVSLCSSTCRIKALEAQGIIWNPMHTAEDRWRRAQIPAEYSIPPAALAVLIDLAQSFEMPTFELPEDPSSIVPSYSDVPEYPEPELLDVDEFEEEDYLIE